MRFSLIALFAIASLGQATPMVGTPGHIKVELKTSAGWIELYQPAYNLQQARHVLSVPAEMARGGKVTLRLSPTDNDETQIDQLALEGGKLLRAKNLTTGQDLYSKLNKADRDVAEVHGQQVEAVLSVPPGATELKLVLEARSSNNAMIPNTPFRLGASAVKGADRDAWGRILLAPTQGQRVDIDAGVMGSSSGHPSAPMFGHLRVEGDRLKGHLDFGPDNDPGDDDYAAIVAYDAQGQAKEFKITQTDERYGKAKWAYAPAPAADWQHMTFDMDVKLSEIPRDKFGNLALELLAYGTCSGSWGSDWDAAASGGIVLTSSVPNVPILWDVKAQRLTYGGNTVNQNISFTAWVMDAQGNTLTTLLQTRLHVCGAGDYETASFTYTAPCNGTYTLLGYADGAVNDPNVQFVTRTTSVIVTSSGACASATPTFTRTATPTATPTDSPTITVTRTSTPTVTPGSPVATAPAGTPLTQMTAPDVQVLMTSTAPGGTMTFAFPKVPTNMRVLIYTLNFELVADISASNANPQWKTKGSAPGIYLCNMKGTLSDGTNVDTWKKGAITFK